MYVSKITTISMSKENACIEAIILCQFIIVISLSIADLWSNVLKSD